jgi:predicted ribosomally synthesized peptide with nif11-like leader
MKEQTLIAFITYLDKNKECSEKVKELGNDNAAIAAYARELGYNFTPDELSDFKAKAQQLIGDKWRQLDEEAFTGGAKNFMEFTKLAETDNEIAKRVAELSGKPQGLIEFGKEKGFDFNAQDMKKVAKKLMEQEEELSDEELESVAGGFTLSIVAVIGLVAGVGGLVGGAAVGAAAVGAVAVATAVSGD